MKQWEISVSTRLKAELLKLKLQARVMGLLVPKGDS